MSKDYGERWRMGGLSAINRHGCPIDISEHARAVACVNALAGIPTESLPEVKNAWLAWKLWEAYGYCYTPEFSHKTSIGINAGKFDKEIEYVDESLIIKESIELRSRGADFGELNALLDSIA